MNTLENDKMIESAQQPETKPERMADDVIIHGSTWAAIWHMTWPLFLNMVTISVGFMADLYVAGQLGPNTQAAIGLGGQVWFFMILLAVALSAGTNALVSRFWGEGNLAETEEAARQSILFAVLFGLGSMVVGLLGCRPLLRALGASPAVEQLAWDYLKIDLIGQLPWTVLWVTNSIFRAKGNARAPMVIMALIVAVVIALDIILCLNPLHVGIAGIGIAWLVGAVLGVGLSIWLLARTEIKECLNLRKMVDGASRKWFKRLMHIGIPACVQDLSWVGGNFVLFLIFAHTKDPTACQASWAVGFRLEEMLGGFPIYALSIAIGTIIGQNLGAKQPERAELAGWQVAAVGAAFNCVIGALLFFGADFFARKFSSEPRVIEYSVAYLRIVGLSEPFLAVWLVLTGALNGAGYTRWTMWATVACMNVIRLPLSWYLTVNMNMGPQGTWYAIAVTSVAAGLLFIWRFKTGVWKLQQV